MLNAEAQLVVELPDGRVFLIADVRRPAAFNRAIGKPLFRKRFVGGTVRAPRETDRLANEADVRKALDDLGATGEVVRPPRG